MLLIYPVVLLCFNFVYINCDAPNANLRKSPRRLNFSSRNIQPTELSATTETLIDIVDTNDLPTELPKIIEEAATKKNVTRVRKQKRRRVVNKTLVPTDILAEKIKNVEAVTIFKDSFNEKHEVEKVVEQKIENNENKVELAHNTQQSLVSNRAVKVSEKTPESTVTERINQNKENVGGPRTFPKRPAEFNPVFKKRRERDPVVRIVDEKNYVYGHNGNFHYSFEGADGTKVYGKGNLLSSPQQKAGEAVVGGYFYKDEEGNDYSLSYTADEHGYQPVGAHLPTPPPIPPAIARALEYLATKPNPEPTERYYS